MEKWDLYDENRKPLNKIHIRGEQKQKGEYHLVAVVYSVTNDNKLLLTKRDYNKSYGGMWEVTGGSVLSGETTLDGAVRELYEETGLKTTKAHLQYIGQIKEESAFLDCYLYKGDFTVNDIMLQEGETIDKKIVDFSTFEKAIVEGEIAAPIALRYNLQSEKIKALL